MPEANESTYTMAMNQTKKPNNCRMKTGQFNTLPHWNTFIESKACPLMVKWT